MRFEGCLMLMWFRKILPTVALASGIAQGAYSLDPSVALADEQEASRPVAQETARIYKQYEPRASQTRSTEPRASQTRATEPRDTAERTTLPQRGDEQPVRPVSLNAPEASQVRQMIQTLDRSAFFVNTVSARMNVTIKRGGTKAMSLDGVYVGDANGNLRLRLTGLFGILAMDVTVKDGTMTCWMPTKKLLVQASREELMNDAHSELAVLAAVGQARELFFPRPWADGATQRRLYANDTDMRIGVFGGSSGRSCLRDYSIDPVENAVRSLDVLTERGESIGHIDYAQYQALTKLDNSDEKNSEWRSAFKVPRSLKLADGAGRLTLECSLEGLRVNETLKANAFDMELPKGVTPQKAQALEAVAREMSGAVAAKAD